MVGHLHETREEFAAVRRALRLAHAFLDGVLGRAIDVAAALLVYLDRQELSEARRRNARDREHEE